MLTLFYILFYRIYREKVADNTLSPLSEITRVNGLQDYFNSIKAIGFGAIYSVNILKHIVHIYIYIYVYHIY